MQNETTDHPFATCGFNHDTGSLSASEFGLSRKLKMNLSTRRAETDLRIWVRRIA
jgi:hypothetical protein